MRPRPTVRRIRPLRRLAVALVVPVVALSACLPAPTAGRSTPVRRVVVLGDSISWGLFTTTPTVREPLAQRLGARRIQLRLIGGPGETPLLTWPGWTPWLDELRRSIDEVDPDVVVIQSMLFPGGEDPVAQDRYRHAVRALYDVAASRGAHVYRVQHPVPPVAAEARQLFVAQAIQADEAAGRGIGVVRLDAAFARCRRPFVADGWHVSAAGQRCHAAAVTAEVDALRRIVG